MSGRSDERLRDYESEVGQRKGIDGRQYGRKQEIILRSNLKGLF